MKINREHETRVRDSRVVVVNILKYAILTLGAFIMLFPFLWMVTTSLKTLAEATKIPPQWLPAEPQWSNYLFVWESEPFPRYLLNTVIVCIIHVIGVVLCSVLGAFGFTMYEFRFKNALFTLFLMTMMVPSELLIIQNYITISKMKLMDTFAAILLPSFASGFYTYMLREHFMQMPPALYKAAKVDGISNLRFLRKVMVPMNKNTIATIAILSFISQWNAFMWPNLVTRSEKTRIISSGLISFRSEASSNVHYLMAGSCLVLIPMVFFYILFRKKIMNGVAGGTGIKG